MNKKTLLNHVDVVQPLLFRLNRVNVVQPLLFRLNRVDVVQPLLFRLNRRKAQQKFFHYAYKLKNSTDRNFDLI